MNTVEKTSIKIYNEFQPNISYEKTREIVWWFKIRCVPEEKIHKWFQYKTTDQENVIQLEKPLPPKLQFKE